ncbi:MAG: fibronectin type III domain-containing protein [Bacteroidia bacterium]|nr:fibronectin type III domain-containing protein [Bacteroidia bacterium]MDW8159658.1 fibronectin type III domain-containing protein [Bacteroidia bacterium]
MRFLSFLIVALFLALGKPLFAQPAQPLNFFPTPNNQVNALAIRGNILYIGGAFTSIGGVERKYIAAIDLLTGNILPFNPQLNGEVNDILIKNDLIYIAGQFTEINNQSKNYLAALNLQTGQPIAWNPILNAPAHDLASKDNLLFVAGDFTAINNSPTRYLVAFDLNTGQPTSWKPNPDDHVRSLAIWNNTLYVGGSFFSISGEFRERLAGFDISTGNLLPWAPSVDGDILDMVVEANSSTLYIGGNFLNVEGAARSKVAAFNILSGELLPFSTIISPGPSFYVHSLALTPTSLMVGGFFTHLGPSQHKSSILLRKSDAAALPWNPTYQFIDPSRSIINASAFAGNKIILGGNFRFAPDKGYLAIYDCPSPAKPIINAIPSTFICSGRPIELNIRSTFFPNQNYYEWLENEEVLGSFSNRSAIFTDFAATYKAVAINGCESSVSETVTTTIAPSLQTPVITFIGNPTFCLGSSIELRTNIQMGADYMWERDGVVVGGNAPNYIASQRGSYTVTVSNACGSFTSEPVLIQTDVAPPLRPTIRVEGDPQGTCQGQSITLSYNRLEGVTYEWLRNGTTLGTSQNPLSITQEGEYSLRASNTCGTVNSTNTISFTPILPPSQIFSSTEFKITASGPTTFCQGQSVRLTVPAHPNVNYQWFKDNQPIQGSTSPAIVVTTSGSYNVIARNACGSIASINTIRIRVIDSPIDLTQTEFQRCGSGFVTFTATGNEEGELRLYNANQNLIDSDNIPPYVVGTFQNEPSATYFLESVIGGCQSPKVRVTVNIRPLPEVLVANDVSRCSPGNLVITTNNLPGTTIRLYTLPSGGTPIATSTLSTITTPFLTTTTTFYLESVNIWGCVSDGRMPVIAAIQTDPSLRISTVPVTRCGGGPVTFTVTATAPVRLFSSVASTIPIAVDLEPPYLVETPYITTNTTFYIESFVGECASRRIPAIANVTAAPFFDAGIDQTIPCGKSVILSATLGGTNYQWEPATGINNPMQPTIVVSPKQTTTYSVRAILGNCEVFDTVQVRVVNPELQVNTTASTICLGSEARISVRGGGNYSWQPREGLTFINNETVIASPRVTTTYTISSNVGECESSSIISISVQPGPIVSATANTQQEVEITATGGLPPYTYRLGTQVQTSNQFENVQPGTYQVTVTDSRGCSGQSNVTVFPATCPAIRNLQVINITAESANVTWLPVVGAINYEIEIRKEGESNWQMVSTRASNYVFTNLSPTTRYDIRMRAFCRFGITEYAFTSFLTTFTCNPPINLRVSNVAATSALLTWRAENNALSYLVRLEKENTPPTQFSINFNSFQLTGLEPGSNYRVTIRSNCSATNSFELISMPSNVLTFSTPSAKIGTSSSNNGVIIYPNPSKGIITVSSILLANQKLLLRLRDVKGNLIFEDNFESNEYGEVYANLSNIVSGLYILEVFTQEGKNYRFKLAFE